MAVYKLKDAGIWLRVIGQTMPEAGRRGLLAAAHRTVTHITTSIIPNLNPSPVDRGAYKAGWKVIPTPHGALIQNIAPHAALIEHGVRAANVKIGREMIEALTKWVKRKGIGGRAAVGKDGKARAMKATDTEAQGIAWAIAKSMQKNGIFRQGKGFHVLKKAGAVIPMYVREEVAREIRKEFS